ncbi:MAG TPA: cyclic nucleotide-binding domain-containing protein [Gaiellaceae bacterium]|jgi:CRP-like cAMP-binding protein
MLHKDAKIELIRRVPLFSRCSKKDLQAIASVADELDFREGKVLTKEGSPGREFFILVEGTADVRRGGRKLRTLDAGDFFGELALLTGRPRTATVTTTSPARALIVTERSFKNLLRQASQLQARVLEAVVERLPQESP